MQQGGIGDALVGQHCQRGVPVTLHRAAAGCFADFRFVAFCSRTPQQPSIWQQAVFVWQQVALSGSSQQCFTLDSGQQRVWVAQQEAACGLVAGALATAKAAGARSSIATEAARRDVMKADIA